MRDKKLAAQYHGLPCICCGTTEGTVGHHVKTVGSGGSNEPYNIMVLCNPTHQLIHQHGLSYVAVMHYPINEWLTINGWERCDYRKKWVRYA